MIAIARMENGSLTYELLHIGLRLFKRILCSLNWLSRSWIFFSMAANFVESQILDYKAGSNSNSRSIVEFQLAKNSMRDEEGVCWFDRQMSALVQTSIPQLFNDF